MPRKQDPVIAVLKYFEEAELPLAQQALTLAQQILRRRGPQDAPKPRPKAKAKKPAPPTGTPTPTTMPALN